MVPIPGGMLSNIRDAGDHVILNGSKMWISNAPFAQVAVVWAKDEPGDIRGMVVERGMEGFSNARQRMVNGVFALLLPGNWFLTM